jgi:Leucine-rich repeat (LRR) protein
MTEQLTAHLLELPRALLAVLFQHVASGPGGVAHAAAFSQTCKVLHSLSEGPAVIYKNLSLAAAISSPAHPAWQWLARRCGRIAGLSLELRLEMFGDDATEDADQLPAWLQPLQTLSDIPRVHLRVEWGGIVNGLDHPCVAYWLQQHGVLISHLTVVVHVSEGGLTVKDFSEAAAPCRSIHLTINHRANHVVDLTDLAPVAGSLLSLTSEPSGYALGSLRGASAFNNMSQLTALRLEHEDLQDEEPWGSLANLTSLQKLSLTLYTSGDPSPLSTLTGLSDLNIQSPGCDDRVYFSFSSLQPLSMLRRLEVLHLGSYACAATSLQGLAGLSKLKQLEVDLDYRGGSLKSLEGIGSEVIDLSIMHASALVDLAGIEVCKSLECLSLYVCGISSLQPIRSLESLIVLKVFICKVASLEGLEGMPALQSLSLVHCSSLNQLSGVEHLSALKSLKVESCGVTSLQPLSQLGKELQKLSVVGCNRVQEEILELPHVQPTVDVVVRHSNVQEVVLAGGVRRAVASRAMGN